MNAKNFVVNLIVSGLLVTAIIGYCICCVADKDFGHDIYDDIRERHSETID